MLPDCFISHVHADASFARAIHQVLTSQGVDTFIAPISLRPGEDWSEAIRTALQDSRWILFLASKQACQSHYVQQELGGAFFGGKTVIPIVWEIAPEELPGWAKRFQAVDLRGKTPEEIAAEVKRVAGVIHSSIVKSRLIALGLIGGLLYLTSKD